MADPTLTTVDLAVSVPQTARTAGASRTPVTVAVAATIPQAGRSLDWTTTPATVTVTTTMGSSVQPAAASPATVAVAASTQQSLRFGFDATGAIEQYGFEAWTLPTTGSFTRKYHLTRDLERYSITDRYAGLSTGTLHLSEQFHSLDTLLKVDEANRANDQGSVIRVTQSGTPIGHYVVTEVEDEWDDRDPTVKVALAGIEQLLDGARVLAYDYPANPTTDPDWIYGAESVLTAIGGETSTELQEIWRNAAVSTGTIKITDGTDTTPALPWNFTATQLATALEAFTGINDVRVAGDGALKTPYEIEFVSPSSYVQLAFTENLTNGNWSVSTTRDGGTLSERPWHKSYNPVSGVEHGNYQTFQIDQTTVPPGDTYSLKLDADSVNWPADYAGAQQIVSVVPGRTYRATIPVYSADGYRMRLVIRDMSENLIGVSPDTDVPAATWTTLDAGTFTIPTGVEQVIYRIGLLTTTNVNPIYIGIESALFAPGFPPATLGAILNDLLAPVNTRGVLTWITPTWTATTDSAGNPWNENVSWGIKRGQSFLQLLEYAQRWGYEWRLRWSNNNTRFEWDVFNPNGGGINVAASVAITGRDGGVEGGPIVRRMPDFTYAVAEGESGVWGESENATLTGAWGRLEGYFGNKQGRAGLATLAGQLVTDEATKSSGRRIRLIDPHAVPWKHYQPGDTVNLNLSPKDTKQDLRVEAVTVAQSAVDGAPAYDVHLASMTFDPDTAMAEAVRGLIRKFDGLENVPSDESTLPVFGQGAGGKAGIKVLVASVDAAQSTKDRADFICDGLDDQVEILAAVTAAAGARVELSEGGFYLRSSGANPALTLPNNAWLAGQGLHGLFSATWFEEDVLVAPATNSSLVSVNTNCRLSGIAFYDYWNNRKGCLIVDAASNVTIDACYISVTAKGVPAIRVPRGSGDLVLTNNLIDGDTGNADSGVQAAIQFDGTQGTHWGAVIRNNLIYGGLHSIWVNDRIAGGFLIDGNTFWSPGYSGIRVDCEATQSRGIYWWRITNNMFYGGGGWNDDPNDNQAWISIHHHPNTTYNNVGGNFGGEQTVIANNIMEAGSSMGGIYLANFHGAQIQGNSIEDVRYEAIKLDGTRYALIVGNKMHWCAKHWPGNDMSVVRLLNAASYNYLHGNTIADDVDSATGLQPQYGINIQSTNCVGNIVVGNDLRFVRAGTAVMFDLGTGTQLTYPGGTWGDNFT